MADKFLMANAAGTAGTALISNLNFCYLPTDPTLTSPVTTHNDMLPSRNTDIGACHIT